MANSGKADADPPSPPRSAVALARSFAARKTAPPVGARQDRQVGGPGHASRTQERFCGFPGRIGTASHGGCGGDVSRRNGLALDRNGAQRRECSGESRAPMPHLRLDRRGTSSLALSSRLARPPEAEPLCAQLVSLGTERDVVKRGKEFPQGGLANSRCRDRSSRAALWSVPLARQTTFTDTEVTT